jgi:hypothetical protein
MLPLLPLFSEGREKITKIQRQLAVPKKRLASDPPKKNLVLNESPALCGCIGN